MPVCTQRYGVEIVNNRTQQRKDSMLQSLTNQKQIFGGGAIGTNAGR